MLARWPHRFLSGRDADALLRLFERVSTGGMTLSLIADVSLSRELETGPARAAVRGIGGSGAGGNVARPGPPGLIPCTMVLEPVSGPDRQFRVPLGRAQRIFAVPAPACRDWPGPVRGPAMRGEHAIVCLDGTAEANGQKLYVLRYLQARDPRLAGAPFFAAFGADAAWLTGLEAVPGMRICGHSAAEDPGSGPRDR